MNEKEPLLLTGKFRIPQSITGVINRADLETRLLKALDNVSICLITAPAGFGKTTLVSQSLSKWDYPVAWLQLDTEDNDPIQFWAYLTAALRMIHPALPNYSQSIVMSPDNNEPLIKIANFLETIKEPFALVLDDFHHVVSEVVYRQLEWFINRELPCLRLILLSRNENPLNLARLQVRHHSEIITSDSLRFTPNEVRTFLKQTMVLDVDNTLVNHLSHLAEGWPAALHLMALRLRHQPKERFSIEQFTFPDANVTHYFDEEIFDPLPREVQDFLLRTSILKDIQPDLCRTVAGIDGQYFLEQLTRNQSFVTQMDRSGKHYRYHSLFSEYLQARLKRDHPDWFQTAHLQAAAYFQQHNMIELAVEHTIASGDLTHAETLISEAAWNFVSLGRRDTVRTWIESIPAERLEHNPRLSVHYAWVLYLQGHFDRVEHYLLLAEHWLSHKAHLLSKHDSQALSGEIHTIRALLAHLSGNLKSAIEHSQQALQLLPLDQTFIRGCALGNLGYSQWLDGDTNSGQLSIESDFLPPHPLDELTRLIFQCNQANLLILIGQLHEAAQLLRNILAIAETDPKAYQIVTAMAYFGIGVLEFAWNKLDQAADHVREGLLLGQPWIYLNGLLPAYLTLAGIENIRHHYQAADQALSEMESHIQAGGLTHMRELLEINRIRLKMARGEVKSARRWVLRLQNDDPIEPNSTAIWRHITHAEILITQNQAEQALELLRRLNALCGLLSLEWMRLDVQLLQSIAHWNLGQQVAALTLLQEILVRAEPESHIRLFLDRGSVVENMLRHLYSPTDSVGYISDLLKAFEDETRRSGEVISDMNGVTIGEKLSSRELEILSLIAQGATNKDIADKLVISEGTVKTHVKHILSKLDAQNRTDAIAKARSRSLLD